MKRYVESVLTPRKRVKALLMLKEFVFDCINACWRLRDEQRVRFE